MLEKIGALPEGLGKVDHLLADTGYFSAGWRGCVRKGGRRTCDRAMGRQPHHPPLSERFAAAPEAPRDPTPVEAMAHRLKSPEGRALYALRKQDPGAGVLGHHQSRARISSIFPARARKRARRVEPRDHGLEFETDVLVLNPAC